MGMLVTLAPVICRRKGDRMLWMGVPMVPGAQSPRETQKLDTGAHVSALSYIVSRGLSDKNFFSTILKAKFWFTQGGGGLGEVYHITFHIFIYHNLDLYISWVGDW